MPLLTLGVRSSADPRESRQIGRIGPGASLSGVDVGGIVAGWLSAYLDGEMTGSDLVHALRDLDVQLPVRFVEERGRLATLIREVDAAVTGPNARTDAEDAATRFLGAHPAEVTNARPAPDWWT